MSEKKPSPTPRYLPIDRKQFFLEPLDVDRLIDDDHRARKIWRVVEQLDLSRFASEVRAVGQRWDGALFRVPMRKTPTDESKGGKLESSRHGRRVLVSAPFAPEAGTRETDSGDPRELLR